MSMGRLKVSIHGVKETCEISSPASEKALSHPLFHSPLIHSPS